MQADTSVARYSTSRRGRRYLEGGAPPVSRRHWLDRLQVNAIRDATLYHGVRQWLEFC